MRRLSLSIILASVFMLLMGISAFGKVIYVNQNATPPEGGVARDGTSWEKAFLTIGEAVTASTANDGVCDENNPDIIAGDEIWVAAGTYNERVTMKAGTGLYGGFAGGESERTLRNWAYNRTIIDGGSNGTVITIPAGAPDFTEVSGFYIKNGSAATGGGIKCASASAIINNNVISNCSAEHGGGIYVGSGSTIIANNVLYNNQSGSGTAIYASNASSDIIGNTITDNDSGSAASIYGESSDLKIHNNIVAFNSSGISLASTTSSLRNNCVYGNTGYDYSGVTAGLGSINADPMFANAGDRDYHLAGDSPCMEAGVNSSIPQCISDMDGQPRLAGQYVDIGADETGYTAAVQRTTVTSEAVTDEMSLLTLSAVIYVKKHTGGTHDGSSWDNAYDNIQDGLNAAASGDEIWVAANTYNERITLKNGVKLYGGFVGNETSSDSRNGGINITTVDGQAGGCVVYSGSSVTSSAYIEGFHITNGIGTLSGSYRYGGGIYCDSSSPNIKNNTIEANTATYGAGIYVTGGTPSIRGNNIRSNNGVKRGGGIYASTSGAIDIRSNIVSANTLSGSDALGAALYLYGSPGTVKNNHISGNQSAFKTGGIFLYGGSPTIINNSITGNTSTDLGGGIMAYLSSPTIINNTIAGNTGATDGGGICCDSQSTAIIADNIIAFNTKGIYKSASSTVTLTKNCVYSNTTYNYNGLSAGQTDISVDPLFADRMNSDYHLTIDSPCVDAGDDNSLGTGWTDVDGQTRINGAHVDIGGDEMYPVETPTFSPDGGSFTTSQTLTMSCTTSGSSIRYTTDGTAPTKTSTLYTGPLTISSTCTVKAIGLLSLHANSHEKSEEFMIDTVAPSPGTASCPATSSTSKVTVTFSGAADEANGSGLEHVELWMKEGSGGTWRNTGLTKITGSGSFLIILNNDATYYFGLVAQDNVANRSATPTGSGDCNTVFTKDPLSSACPFSAILIP